MLTFDTVKTNRWTQQESRCEYTQAEFVNEHERLGLKSKINSLSELNHLLNFQSYGQTIAANMQLRYILGGNEEKLVTIKSVDEANAELIVEPAVQIGEQDAKTNLSFAELLDLKHRCQLEQDLSLEEAKRIAKTHHQLHQNTLAHAGREEFLFQKNTIFQLGNYSFQILELGEQELSIAKIDQNPDAETARAPQGKSYSYARIIFHLKHSSLQTVQPGMDDQQASSAELTEPPSNKPTDENPKQEQMHFDPLNLGSIFELETPTAIVKRLLSEYVNFASVASIHQVFRNIGEAIKAKVDRQEKKAGYELGSNLPGTVGSTSRREALSALAQNAQEYQEKIKNNDIESHFTTLYSPKFGTGSEDLFKAQAIIEILVKEGYMRFESPQLIALIPRLLKLNKQSEPPVTEKSGKKGSTWVIQALGMIYGKPTAEGWQSSNEQAFNSKKSEGVNLAGSKLTNVNNHLLVELHNSLIDIQNGNISDTTPHPAHLLGYLDCLVDNTCCSLEDKLFYTIAFAAISYYGDDAIMPNTFLASGADYAKHPYFGGFWTTLELYGVLFTKSDAEELFKRFSFKANKGQSNAEARYDVQAVRDFFWPKLGLSQKASQDTYEQNCDKDIASHHERFRHFTCLRYSLKTIKDQVIGTSSPTATTLPAIQLGRMCMGYGQGFAEIVKGLQNNDIKEDVAAYNLNRMIPAWFALATAVEGRNEGAERVKFDTQDYKENDGDWIDPAGSPDSHLSAVNEFLRELFAAYRVPEAQLRLWFDREHSQSSRARNKEAHDPQMQEFFSKYSEIAQRSDFIEKVQGLGSASDLGFRRLG